MGHELIACPIFMHTMDIAITNQYLQMSQHLIMPGLQHTGLITLLSMIYSLAINVIMSSLIKYHSKWS